MIVASELHGRDRERTPFPAMRSSMSAKPFRSAMGSAHRRVVVLADDLVASRLGVASNGGALPFVRVFVSADVGSR
jgi:hypothetical protein